MFELLACNRLYDEMDNYMYSEHHEIDDNNKLITISEKWNRNEDTWKMIYHEKIHYV